MSLLKEQNFLARLFTDETLRDSFWDNPERIGKQHGLDQSEIKHISDVIRADLNYFADSLFHKRLHEAERLLPLTKRALGNDFAKLFREFSKTFQPLTFKKHLEDAIQFCKYLEIRSFDSSVCKDTARFEKSKHIFYADDRWISFCFLRHNVFNGRKKIGFSAWIRFGNRSHNFIL